MPRVTVSCPSRRGHCVLAVLVVLAGLVAIPMTATSAAAEVRSIVFPVAGGASWSDTFGAPRSGGRSHEGQDLFAPKMRHLVSAVDGTIARTGRGAALSGNYVVVRDAQGWEYVYVHVNNDRPGTDDGSDLDLNAFPPGIYPGAAVYAGQHIAYLGDSGNAEGTPPHLHFEIRKPNGSGEVESINASESLRAARHDVLDTSRISGIPFGVIDSTHLVPNGGGARGWALDPDLTSPSRIEAYVDKELVGTFTAPNARADVGAAYPANGPDHGFDTGIVMSPGVHELCLAVRNDVGPAGWLGCGQVDRPSNPIGALDAVARVPGGIGVAGWAIDADTDAAINVEAQFGSAAIRATASLSRGDLAAALPGFGTAHGFTLVLPSGPGQHNLCVFGLNAVGGGGSSILGCRGMELRSEPVGSIDGAVAAFGTIYVAGWALDPDTAESIEVHTYVDEAGYNLGPANGSRTDVAAAYPGWGAAHGYFAGMPAGPGTHRVCVYGINKAYGGNAALGCPTLTMPTGSPFGTVDVAAAVPGGVQVSGWSLDPDTAESTEIHVYIDGAGTNLGLATTSRSDVAAAYPGAGPSHGFNAVVGAAPGPHEVCVFAIDRVGGQGPTLLSCRRT